MSEAQKKELLRRGGTLEDWNQILGGGLAPGDSSWVRGETLGHDVKARAQEVMVTGGFLEYDCYDGQKRPQGRATLRLDDWVDSREGTFRGEHLGASDEYYEYYAKRSLGTDQVVYHLCEHSLKKCPFRLPRGDRRELIHVHSWRMTSPLLMMERGYAATAAKNAVDERVMNFTARVPEPAPAGAPGGRAPGTNLDETARALAAEAGLDEFGEPLKEKEEASRRFSRGTPRGSVGDLLQKRVMEQRAALKEKERDTERKKERKRSRTPRRRRRRGGDDSKSRSVSRESKSSEHFRLPSTRGEDELLRLSEKHPGRLLKETMKQLDKYLAERSDCVPGEDSWMDRRMMAYVNQIVLSSHPPQSMGVRNYREILTLAKGIDYLLQGQLSHLGDLLVQRLKALETSLTDQSWHAAKHQELLPAQGASLTSEQERRRAAKQELGSQKLKDMMNRTRFTNK